ncbi:transcription factor Cmr1 [Tothia fuscella]|uniref:Transcription factor Cmr1 n=1 Tax=Tothia fuscella TaxID=1048955 RepID=A0A9P4NQ02_9PEZI|nr:transcription factor Cmr1 [Tothia fuscella]
MVFCTYCGQSFTRDEHLERHILTHTNVKPFKCFTCHMSFARRDLLQRHYTVHGRDQNNQEGLPPNPMIPKSAGRTPIACSNCAKTKTKCDKKFPCSRCASRNLKCTLRPTRRASKNANRGSTNTDANGQITPVDQSVAGTPDGSKSNSPAPQSQPIPTTDSKPQNSQNTRPEIQRTSLNRTPSFFEMSPAGAPATALPTVLSPLPTSGTMAGNGYQNTTPISGFEEFTATREGSEIGASPRYMMDWSQMNFSPGPQYEQLARPDMMLGPIPPAVGLFQDPRDTAILTMIPEFPQGMPSVQTPIATPPRLDGTMCELEIGSSGTLLPPSSRHTSVSECGSGDIPAVIVAQDGWNCFRSAPTLPPGSCPTTGRQNLERLEHSLKNHKIWSSWRPAWEDSDNSKDNLEVVPLHECSRDKLLAIMQTFLHKALEIHRDGSLRTPAGSASPSSTSSNFVLLPPSGVLQYFLRAYANSFERFFPMTSRGVLDVNEQLRNPTTNDKAASLLTLMMIAQGATSIPSLEARWLNGGLTEACRISLFDLIEKNIALASNQTVLHSALLFTASAAWSGDKWQMDIAMGQRGMYFAMLRHSGVLEPKHVMTPPMSTCGTPEGLWSDWIQQESTSRLIYSWAMVDQDVSLFRDTAPLFNVTEFGAPMPDADRLWHAKTGMEWSATFEQVHQLSNGYSSIGSGARPLSLRELFRHFLDDEIMSLGIELTPLHLRLLLHPLQSLVCQYCQLLSCFSDNLGARQRTKSVTAASTRCRLEEVQALLQRWYDLADRYIKSNPGCAMMQSSLTIFHLISLNAVTNFPEVERLARKEGFDGSYQQLMWIHKRCISDVEEATFHAGQVLRLVRSMPLNIRPPWWAGAIYRVALVLWTDSLTHTESISPATGLFPVPGPSFAVDSLAPDHPLIIRYLQKREGVPTLTKQGGSQIPLDHAFTILSHCVEVIDEGISTRFSDGIRNKLERLARGG